MRFKLLWFHRVLWFPLMRKNFFTYCLVGVLLALCDKETHRDAYKMPGISWCQRIGQPSENRIFRKNESTTIRTKRERKKDSVIHKGNKIRAIYTWLSHKHYLETFIAWTPGKLMEIHKKTMWVMTLNWGAPKELKPPNCVFLRMREAGV